MRNKATLGMTTLILSAFVLAAGCGGGQKTLAVSDVIRNARALDGKTIRVRGQAYFWMEPSREEMWMFGGCAINPDGSPSKRGHVVGWLALYDEVDSTQPPREEAGLTIAESDFHCEGNYCTMTCGPFEPVTGRTFELVGTLRAVNEQSAEMKLVLENLDLDESRQFVNEKWAPIPTGDFGFVFP